MTKTLLTTVFSILAGVWLLQAIQPQRAQAAIQAPTAAAHATPTADVTWPAPQEPFDMTPVTPVESAGASMHETF